MILACSAASTLNSEMVWSAFGSLAPLCLTPIFTAIATVPAARLQLAQRWSVITTGRTAAALAGTSAGVAVALMTSSIVGATLALLLSEAIFAAHTYLGARAVPPVSNPEMATGAVRAFLPMVCYSILGWGQGQMDRVLVGAFSGTASLGNLTVASSVARSAGDAVAASQANVLRVDLNHTQGADSAVREIVARSLRSSYWLCAATIIATIGATYFIVRPLLGASWELALAIVPILVLTTIPSAISWSAAPVHVHRGTAKRAMIAPSVGIVFAPVVAYLSTSGLELAAWAILAREMVLAITQVTLMGRAAPWGQVIPGFAATLALSAALLTLPT